MISAYGVSLLSWNNSWHFIWVLNFSRSWYHFFVLIRLLKLHKDGCLCSWKVVYDAYYAYGIFVTFKHAYYAYLCSGMNSATKKYCLFYKHNMGVYTWIWQQENVLQNPDAAEFELTTAFNDHIMLQLDLESAFSSLIYFLYFLLLVSKLNSYCFGLQNINANNDCPKSQWS